MPKTNSISTIISFIADGGLCALTVPYVEGATWADAYTFVLGSWCFGFI